MTAFWRIGQHIRRVDEDPETYLLEEQRDAHVSASALLVSIFSSVYSAEQLRAAEAFYDKYPTDRELARLINMRCPERPSWRITPSHVQLLAQISDDEQRSAIEEKCAEEALTAKSLATELQEIRGGKKSTGGRKHQAPVGLKNQVYDLLQHLRKVNNRAEALWLSDDNVFDALINAAPSRREGVVMDHFREVMEQLTVLSDNCGALIAMANKAAEALAEDSEKPEQEQEAEASEIAASARRAAAAAAASRRTAAKITR